jgi:uncharacterized protein (DUF2384 family)
VKALARARRDCSGAGRGSWANRRSFSASTHGAERTARQLADRVNSSACQLGGLKFAIAWLKTPTRDLGSRSTIDVLKTNFDVAIIHIDGRLAVTPD